MRQIAQEPGQFLGGADLPAAFFDQQCDVLPRQLKARVDVLQPLPRFVGGVFELHVDAVEVEAMRQAIAAGGELFVAIVAFGLSGEEAVAGRASREEVLKTSSQ